jgi:hypothetical protein
MERIQAPGKTHLWLRNNVLGLLAIFIALGGTSVAAQVASSGTGPHAKVAKKKKAKPGPAGPQGLPGTQGLQGTQGPPGPSTGPAGGDLQGSYPNPTLKPPPAATLAGLPDWVAGTCAGAGGWQDFAPDFNQSVGFYRDSLGRVHLQGMAVRCTGTSQFIFDLPEGYRPQTREYQATLAGPESAQSLGGVLVDGSGFVAVVAGTVDDSADGFISLNGISFRCGPSGQDGCP